LGRLQGKLGLEGIVSKRLGSRYRSGHSRDWLFQKFRGTGREAGGRGGAGEGEMAMTADQRRGAYFFVAAMIIGAVIAFLARWWFG
jgi:hypothetical protein